MFVNLGPKNLCTDSSHMAFLELKNRLISGKCMFSFQPHRNAVLDLAHSLGKLVFLKVEVLKHVNKGLLVGIKSARFTYHYYFVCFVGGKFRLYIGRNFVENNVDLKIGFGG